MKNNDGIAIFPGSIIGVVFKEKKYKI